ncbi:hypothetical protein, partial [Xylanibacter rodentium]|uniref:hypothetical protein n=2 Tax=Xylanibacter rodentium TaxID=2736289 RepID=UPI002576EE8C
EQRTENPCVPGSIPGGTTPPFISPVSASCRVFFFYQHLSLYIGTHGLTGTFAGILFLLAYIRIL